MKIPISKAKQIRESLNVTHLVILAKDESGADHVATHGKTMKQAKESADMGNKLKRFLKWPEALCNSKPLERICKNCIYHTEGHQTPGYYTPDKEECVIEPVKIFRRPDERACRLFEPNC